MKFLFPLLFIVPFTINAQEYTQFISTEDSSDTWVDLYSWTDHWCYESYTHRYQIHGDTIIEGTTYAKIYRSYVRENGSVASMWCDESTYYSSNGYFGAIRESDKKIYLLPYGFPIEEEHLAYDFNLSIGDTLPCPSPFEVSDPADRIIDSIDSVLVFDSYRKRYNVGGYLSVIEGIGASTGLFNRMVMDMSYEGATMLCYAENLETDYFTSGCEELYMSIPEQPNNTQPVELVKIVDFLGREVAFKPNTPLIYIYSDGSTKKVMQIE